MNQNSILVKQNKISQKSKIILLFLKFPIVKARYTNLIYLRISFVLKVGGSFYSIFFFALKALINSIITSKMTFTKTSQKFGQWIDFKYNLVYGLGFSNDMELNKVNFKIIF